MSERAPFGRVLTAMVTPFDVAGALDLDAAAELATYLVDEMANDGLVINGTAGESPTTTRRREGGTGSRGRRCGRRSGPGAQPGSGRSTPCTRVHLAQGAAKAGAHGVLVVTPYYSKPPQAGVVKYFRTVADASDAASHDLRHPAAHRHRDQHRDHAGLAEHERIVAVKDAKGDLVASQPRAGRTDLAYYCGEDGLTLPMLAIGAVGVVGTSTHFSGGVTKAMIDAFDRGDVHEARRLHEQLLPIYLGIFATPGSFWPKPAWD